MTLKQRKQTYIGRPAVFAGYDGKFYTATIAEVLPRGYRIEYPVTVQGLTRTCSTHLPTSEAKTRLIVQL